MCRNCVDSSRPSGGNPLFPAGAPSSWMPACAGMTFFSFYVSFPHAFSGKPFSCPLFSLLVTSSSSRFFFKFLRSKPSASTWIAVRCNRHFSVSGVSHPQPPKALNQISSGRSLPPLTDHRSQVIFPAHGLRMLGTSQKMVLFEDVDFDSISRMKYTSFPTSLDRSMLTRVVLPSWLSTHSSSTPLAPPFTW